MYGWISQTEYWIEYSVAKSILIVFTNELAAKQKPLTGLLIFFLLSRADTACLSLPSPYAGDSWDAWPPANASLTQIRAVDLTVFSPSPALGMLRFYHNLALLNIHWKTTKDKKCRSLHYSFGKNVLANTLTSLLLTSNMPPKNCWTAVCLHLYYYHHC